MNKICYNNAVNAYTNSIIKRGIAKGSKPKSGATKSSITKIMQNSDAVYSNFFDGANFNITQRQLGQVGIKVCQ